MKKRLSIIGAVLFGIGFCMATGIDRNPLQAVYTVVFIGAAAVVFNRAAANGKQEKSADKCSEVHNYKGDSFKNVA